MTGNSVIKEGKTAEEALHKALKHLAASKENVLVEVLSPGTRGILGIGAKPAKVKATLKEEVLAERNLKHLLKDLSLSGSLPDAADLAENQAEVDTGIEEQAEGEAADGLAQQKVGTVEVREGKIIVTDPVNDDRKAVVRISDNVRLFLNGCLVEEEAQVSGQDTLEIELINEEPVSSFELKLSRNKMEADVRYMSQPGAVFRLQDQVSAHNLTLLTEFATIIEPPSKDLTELSAFLKEQGVVKGIDEEILTSVIENPNNLRGFLVARGQPPVDGIDAAVRYPFREEQIEEEDGSYFSRNRLISVNQGDVLAIKVPKTEGQDGWTVTGETMPARPAQECEITAKAGCELTEDGNSIVSTIAGRPDVDQSGPNVIVSVDPVYVVKEVSQATGDINFAGDVEVQGDVGEGCVVQADGNIQVAGNVFRAVIRAGASGIIHKSIIGSSVTAGGRTALYASVLPVFKQTRELIDKIFADAKVLKAGTASPGRPLSDGTLIQYVIDSKFNTLPKTVEGLADTVNASSIPAHEEIIDFVSFLRRTLCGLGATQIEKIEFLHDLNNALEHVINMMENCLRRADYIKLRYVQNSSLMSSGDIIIEGQGCYISDIKAGGSVIICGQPGIARGVRILADNDVTVTDLGSEFESRTSVKVGARGKISAELVRPDVLIQVGREKYRVDKASRSFTAYLDTQGNGRLTVDRLTADQ